MRHIPQTTSKPKPFEITTSEGRRFVYFALSYNQAWECGDEDSGVLRHGETVVGACRLEPHEAAKF